MQTIVYLAVYFPLKLPPLLFILLLVECFCKPDIQHSMHFSIQRALSIYRTSKWNGHILTYSINTFHLNERNKEELNNPETILEPIISYCDTKFTSFFCLFLSHEKPDEAYAWSTIVYRTFIALVSEGFVSTAHFIPTFTWSFTWARVSFLWFLCASDWIAQVYFLKKWWRWRWN